MPDSCQISFKRQPILINFADSHSVTIDIVGVFFLYTVWGLLVDYRILDHLLQSELSFAVQWVTHEMLIVHG